MADRCPDKDQCEAGVAFLEQRCEKLQAQVENRDAVAAAFDGDEEKLRVEIAGWRERETALAAALRDTTDSLDDFLSEVKPSQYPLARKRSAAARGVLNDPLASKMNLNPEPLRTGDRDPVRMLADPSSRVPKCPECGQIRAFCAHDAFWAAGSSE